MGLVNYLTSDQIAGKIYSTDLPSPVASATRTNVECIPTFVVDRSGPLFDGPGQLSDQRSDRWQDLQYRSTITCSFGHQNQRRMYSDVRCGPKWPIIRWAWSII